MTYTFKLSRRLAAAPAPILALSLTLAACAADDPTAASDGGAGPTLAEVTVAPKSSRIGVNQTLAFHAQGHSTLGDSMTASVEWHADGATITPDGVFSSNRIGTFQVIGRGKGGREPADTAIVVVDPSALVSIAVMPGSVTLAPGQTQVFSAMGTFSDNHSEVLTGGVTWHSSGGTISSGGSYLAGSVAGSYSVTAASGTLSGSAVATIASNGPSVAIDTIFSETWESGSKAAWTDEGGATLHTILNDPSLAHGGSRVLRVTFPAGQEAGYLQHWFMPGYDSVYVRFWIKLDPAWVGNTKLLSLAGNRIDNRWSASGMAGICPDGRDFFTTGVVMPTSDPNAIPTRLRMYTYYPGMPTQPDRVTCYGSSGTTAGAIYNGTPAALTRGVWHKVEFWVKLNAVSQANGLQRVWMDGQLVGEWPNLVYRSTTDLGLNRVMLGFSHAGAGPAGAQRQMYIDDLVILTGRPAQ